MKFYSSIPSTDPSFLENNEGWSRVESSKKKKIIGGIVLGFILALILETLIDFFIFDSQLGFKFYKKIYYFILIIIAHEFLHLIVLPKPNNAIIGISIKNLIVFIISNEIFTKKRYLFVLLFPTILLTIIPLILLFFLKNELLVYIALYNLVGSGIDILIFYDVIKFPNDALFRFNGEQLYFKQKPLT
jgi:hypothetical protein